MKLKHVYLGLAIPGGILPWYFAIRHAREFGFSFVDLISSNLMSSLLADLLISAIVLLIYIGVNRKTIRHWYIPFVGTIALGVSFGLPMMLYLKKE